MFCLLPREQVDPDFATTEPDRISRTCRLPHRSVGLRRLVYVRRIRWCVYVFDFGYVEKLCVLFAVPFHNRHTEVTRYTLAPHFHVVSMCSSF